jgi:hypothetical protein
MYPVISSELINRRYEAHPFTEMLPCAPALCRALEENIYLFCTTVVDEHNADVTRTTTQTALFSTQQSVVRDIRKMEM